MASATRWQNVCTLGDTYIERSFAAPSSCDNCIGWCRIQCSSFGTSSLKDPCDFTSYSNPVDCQCCCRKLPSSSPQLPPTSTSVGQFTGGNITNICTYTPDQTYLQINHTQGTDCVLSPQCENKCQETGLLSAGSQCVGTLISGEASPISGGVYTWIEQCCCRTPPPPPPSPPNPSPPPPPPPSPPNPSPPPPPPPSPPNPSPPPPPPPSPPPPSPSPPPPSPPPPSPSPTPPPSPPTPSPQPPPSPPPPPPPSPPPPSPSPPPPSPPPPSPSPTPPPSPQTPSPPPPPCPSPPSSESCGCCNSNIDIQIPVTSGYNVKKSTPSSWSAATL